MAVSDVSIANRALMLLAAERIVSLTQDHVNARHVNACYEIVRDAELEAHPWSFAIKHATLAASATVPADEDYSYAFLLPTDCLRVLPPAREGLDWLFVSHTDRPAIYTNDDDALPIRYIARITDPTQFSATFAEALAAKLAETLCEPIAQGNEKKKIAGEQYKTAISRARRSSAFTQISAEPPEDPWLAARR